MNHESVTNIFIANLSFGDVLVIGFALPFRVSNIIYSFISLVLKDVSNSLK